MIRRGATVRERGLRPARRGTGPWSLVFLFMAGLLPGSVAGADESTLPGGPPPDPAAEGPASTADRPADPSAGEAEEPASEEPAPPFADTLLGDPFGLRGAAADAGVRIEATWIGDYLRVQRGGMRPHRSQRHTYLALRALLDGEALAGVPGLAATVEAQFLGGNSRANHAGSVQRPSAYAAADREQWGLVYLEWTAAEEPLRIQAGKLDPSWEFAVTDNGWDFLAADPVYSPNFIGVPVFPDSALGLAAHWEPEKGHYVRATVLDGAVNEGERTGRQTGDTLFGRPADLAAVAETGVRWHLEGWGPGRLGVGGWRHRGTATRRDGSPRNHGAGGWYATLDAGIWRPADAGEDDPRGLAAFARWSIATTSVATEPSHAGGGLVWTGPLPGRPEDHLGLAVFRTRTASDPPTGTSSGAERLVELHYLVRITPWLSITPAVQWYAQPGGDRSRNDAVVFGLRVVVDF